MPLITLPNKRSVYRLPSGASGILGALQFNGFWGQVPWSLSERDSEYKFAGLVSGGLQLFAPWTGSRPGAIFWESDADIDSDGPGGSKAADRYWQPRTSLKWPDGRSCDSRSFQGVVIPPQLRMRWGLQFGDPCFAINNGIVAVAQIYDEGPDTKIGEVSMALARALKIGFNPNTGNDANHVCYLAFPARGNRKAVEATEQGMMCQDAWNWFTGRKNP